MFVLRKEHYLTEVLSLAAACWFSQFYRHSILPWHFNSRPDKRTKPIDCKEAAMEVFGCLLAIKMVSDVYNFCFRIGFGSPVILSPSTFVLQVKRKQL